MKTLKSLFLLLTIISFISCSDDDDGGGVNASIDGTWNATNVDVSGNVSTNVDGNDINTSVSGIPRNLNYTLIFDDGSNSVTSSGGFDIELNVSFLGQAFTEVVEDVAPVGTGSYSISGNDLTITADGETLEVDIIELTDNLMTLSVDTVDESNVDGLDLRSDLETTITFSRQ